MSKAIYPGSFDPLTLGHMDLIRRAATIFDELTVAVLNNHEKSPLFSVEERVKMIKEAVSELPNVKVDSFSGFLVDYANTHGIQVSIRGLRTPSDFEYELPTAQFNRILSKGQVETLFLATCLEYAHLSSSAVREVAKFKGDITGLVPDCILNEIYQKYGYKLEE